MNGAGRKREGARERSVEMKCMSSWEVKKRNKN